jgi:hypothetical protein
MKKEGASTYEIECRTAVTKMPELAPNLSIHPEALKGREIGGSGGAGRPDIEV